MAHIASCMVDANVEEQDGFSRQHEKAPSPQPSTEPVRNTPTSNISSQLYTPHYYYARR